MKDQKVCHISTAHSATDVRIFHKECKSLAGAGYSVTLIAQHGSDEVLSGIKILALPRTGKRAKRMVLLLGKALKRALKEDARLYHIHDPELLPLALFLKLFTGAKIVYDAHEDYTQKILSKDWINKGLRGPVSKLTGALERFCAFFFNFIITTESHTQKRFPAGKSGVIANYPPLSVNREEEPEKKGHPFRAIYVGGITEDRGASVMAGSLGYLNGKGIELHLAGKVFEQKASELFETSRIKYHGRLEWEEIAQHLRAAHVGLVLLQPVPAYLYCHAENITKLFEYMLFGLPVIISDFPKLKEFVALHDCGITVDPTRPDLVAKALNFLYENPDVREKMGRNGRKAVLEKFNWEKESRKLLEIYRKLLD